MRARFLGAPGFAVMGRARRTAANHRSRACAPSVRRALRHRAATLAFSPIEVNRSVTQTFYNGDYPLM
jgi:hypothetical protein